MILNVGQAGIIAAGLVSVMFMAAHHVVQGNMSVGDFVMVGALV